VKYEEIGEKYKDGCLTEICEGFSNERQIGYICQLKNIVR